MPDFDMPGLGKARMGLTQLAKEPANRGYGGVKKELVKELYPEIRAARLAGHSWNRIRAAILSGIKIKLSVSMIIKAFMILDKQYERETGVKALPGRTKKEKKVKA